MDCAVRDEIVDDELDALLDEYLNPKEVFLRDLENDCLGNIVVATANKRLGRDTCSKCDRQKQCNQLLQADHDEIAHYRICFGTINMRNPCVKCHASLCRFSKDKTCNLLAEILAKETASSAGSEHTLAEKPITISRKDTVKLAEAGLAPLTIPSSESFSTEMTAAAGITTAVCKDVTVSTRTGAYLFPINEILTSGMLSAYEAMSSNDLAQELITLKEQVEESGKTQYRPYRLATCAISIALNKKGQIAPRFRVMAKGQFVEKRAGSVDDETLANDRRVIDLDWLARHRQKFPRGQHSTMFGAGGLNYDLASKFASHKGSATAKAKLLSLLPVDQIPLSIIQDKAVQVQWKDLCSGREAALIKIEDAIDRNHGRRKDDPEWLWKLYVILRMSDGHIVRSLGLARYLGQQAPSRIKLDRLVTWFNNEAGLKV